uniref:taurine ABC transporter ATP-binding protein n=1 Tax=Marinobacterium profundum TaxID=1714300 RepID=UPI000AC5B3A7|nr:ABC transporter ATP-binding protein [Marinobacterium profundum]
MSELRVQGVTMTYEGADGQPVRALENINFSMNQDDIVTVLGPSGCGKSTLLNIIAGFLNPTSGRVFIDDREIAGPGPDRGMVFQHGALFEWLTVGENVSFGPRMAGIDATSRLASVDELLQLVGLAGFRDTPIYNLSGGMQQRVALARCLANNPDVILMDEPLGALDALTREKMQTLVLKLWQETQKMVFLITHSVEEAIFLGSRLLVMAPRPGHVVKEFRLPFAAAGLSADPREIKSSREFIAVREEILEMIWSMEEQH